MFNTLHLFTEIPSYQLVLCPIAYDVQCSLKRGSIVCIEHRHVLPQYIYNSIPFVILWYYLDIVGKHFGLDIMCLKQLS